ncbi:hypothetical protein Agub_g15811 [Astrephomene gubernaculifera]|uniref:Uncharacterized protein n=2 Tax=Astrephomene gubernaculifera TaxID=47775 RepID=A0AAD3E3M0_9CHLO|nr:hypothetical protein Agub_g15811 [Astrephomene gubernaculifera]
MGPSDLDAEREATMARNNAILDEIGLGNACKEFKDAAAKLRPVSGKKRQQSTKGPPLRKSSRLEGRPQPGNDQEVSDEDEENEAAVSLDSEEEKNGTVTDGDEAPELWSDEQEGWATGQGWNLEDGPGELLHRLALFQVIGIRMDQRESFLRWYKNSRIMTVEGITAQDLKMPCAFTTMFDAGIQERLTQVGMSLFDVKKVEKAMEEAAKAAKEAAKLLEAPKSRKSGSLPTPGGPSLGSSSANQRQGKRTSEKVTKKIESVYGQAVLASREAFKSLEPSVMEANDLKIIKDMGEHIRCLLGVGQGAPMETVKARLRQAVQVKAKNMRRCSKPNVNLDTVDEEEGLQPASPSAPGEEEEPATPEVPKPYMWAKLPGGDTEKYAAADNHLDWLADFDIGDNAGCILVGSLDKDELVPVTLGCGLLLDPLDAKTDPAATVDVLVFGINTNVKRTKNAYMPSSVGGKTSTFALEEKDKDGKLVRKLARSQTVKWPVMGILPTFNGSTGITVSMTFYGTREKDIATIKTCLAQKRQARAVEGK